jgi:hypothetical protein
MLAKRSFRRVGSVACALFSLTIGCSEPDNSSTPPPRPPASVEIGLPAGDDGLDFQPLEPGAELRLQTFGQGGTHVMLGVRCTNFGNRAFVSIRLRNAATGAEAVTNPPVRPQLLLCRDESVCDLVPLLATTSGLSEEGEERDGLVVQIVANVRNQAGVEAEASQDAVLSTADL